MCIRDSGQIEVTIDKGCVVYNSGSLIDEEEIEDIWYTFVTHDHQGSGLGLAICQSILEMHGCLLYTSMSMKFLLQHQPFIFI